MKQYVVGIGEALWDMLPEGKKLGGAPANFAYHVAQLGLDSIAVSALGDDELGDEISEALEDKNMDFLMPRVDYPTGTVQVEIDTDGVPAYEINEGVAWDNIPFIPEMIEIALEARAVCWGSLAQRDEASRGSILEFINATSEDCLRIFDINLRQHFYDKEVISESLELCDVLKINDEELEVVGELFGFPELGTEQKCRKLMNEYGLKILVLTCGAKGSYVFSGEEMSFMETPKVDVADTVGAGDSFTAAFCASILSGLSVKEAHRNAVDVSAYVCTCSGAMPPLPAEFSARLQRTE